MGWLVGGLVEGFCGQRQLGTTRDTLSLCASPAALAALPCTLWLPSNCPCESNERTPATSLLCRPAPSPHRMEARRRNLAKARRLFRRALEVDPGHTPSLLGLGQLEARDGHPEVALEVGGGLL